MKITTLLFSVLLVLQTGQAFSSGKHNCDDCHVSHGTVKSTLRGPLSDICLGCHPDRKNPTEHKVDIFPSMQFEGLPLDRDGKITCITCHDPHGKSGQAKLLRIGLTELCIKCHIVTASRTEIINYF